MDGGDDPNVAGLPESPQGRQWGRARPNTAGVQTANLAACSWSAAARDPALATRPGPVPWHPMTPAPPDLAQTPD